MAFIVTIDPSESMQRVLDQLSQTSFQVSSVMAELHLVAGEADDATLARVLRIPGVTGVEEDTMIHLDPREIPKMGSGWPRDDDQRAMPPLHGSSWRSPAWEDTSSS
ncbi:MAG: hypothetical protein EA413_09785 [Cyanobium sp. PLM2.Bin73]|nr:MAG: hypothetical protein EA413_09785 [Cyanobium sp. PLM2.Bin73]